MLEELYSHMSGLQSFEKETLMDEEPDVKQRRAAIKQVSSALSTTSEWQHTYPATTPKCNQD